MNKKNIFIGLIATLVLLASFGISKSFAAQDNTDNRWGMMRNFDSDDFQKMSKMHNFMIQGNYDEARKIRQELGMSNCTMGNQGNNNGNSGNSGNFGGMMGGNGRGMMDNF